MCDCHADVVLTDLRDILRWVLFRMSKRWLKLTTQITCLGIKTPSEIRGKTKIDAENGQILTYKDILEKSVKLAEVLKKHNIKVEDKVSIISENHCNWIVAAYASVYLSAVVAPINLVYTEVEFEHVLSILKPRIIFVSRRTEIDTTGLPKGVALPHWNIVNLTTTAG
ncbi:hypothetical protein M0802_014364 [Mischocyttarus mexicanus]|nr:hypothetical protein M0802_014364 [Mischocyttarus mexicanus]